MEMALPGQRWKGWEGKDGLPDAFWPDVAANCRGTLSGTRAAAFEYMLFMVLL